MNTNPIIENILSRCSVRDFEATAIPRETVELIMRATMAAPSAMNKQPWCILAIDEREQLDALSDALPYASMARKAPLGFVLCGDMTRCFPGIEQEYWLHDLGAATQNLLLAAHGLGLGAVWTAVHPVAERINAVKDLLQLPEHLVPFCFIPVGVPKGSPKAKDKWAEERVRWNRWSIS